MLGPVARETQAGRDREVLSEFWESLLSCFISSSASGLGKEEILDYIGSVLSDVKKGTQTKTTL